MSHFCEQSLTLAVFWTAIVGLVGCQGGDLSSPTANRLSAIREVYLDYAAATGTGPQSIAALKSHFKNMPEFVVQKADITPPEFAAALVSHRDEQPFEISLGMPMQVICSGVDAMLAAERVGESGKRLAVFASGKIDFVPTEK